VYERGRGEERGDHTGSIIAFGSSLLISRFSRFGGGLQGCPTVDSLVLTGRKTLTFFGDSVVSCRHSGEKPFQRG